jgi:diguanylate cyclase (GGDEF)-like protein
MPSDFEQAGRAVLEFLHGRFGFQLWMLTRVEGDDWIVLQSNDRGYGVRPGRVFRWADSFCYQMARGDGPRIAPDTTTVPAYVAAPIGREIRIGAYVGVPLTNSDGSLFGTLCGIDPLRQPADIVKDHELIELLALLLSSIIHSDLRAAEESRRRERLEVEALLDPLTRLANRRAWDQLMTREEDRCRRYGHPAAIFVLDLDDLKEVNDARGHAAGDALLGAAAEALREAVRDSDLVARLGGDEFGIIAIECDLGGAKQLLTRIRVALDRREVRASVGISLRDPTLGLTRAWEEADRRMYEQKKTRWPLNLTHRDQDAASPATDPTPDARDSVSGSPGTKSS